MYWYLIDLHLSCGVFAYRLSGEGHVLSIVRQVAHEAHDDLVHFAHSLCEHTTVGRTRRDVSPIRVLSVERNTNDAAHPGPNLWNVGPWARRSVRGPFANSQSGNHTSIHQFTFNYKTLILANEKYELLHHNFTRYLPGESTHHGTKVQTPKHG